MKVSIVIPNFNKSKYLNKCILSAITQTYDDFEVIFVDDCSSDNSFEIAKEYEAICPNLKCYKNEENVGVSKTLNKAISLSSGEYISWLSSDDMYCSDKIQINMLNIKESDLVYSSYYWIDENSFIRGLYILDDCVVEKELYNNHFINGCSVMFSRKAYNYVGGFDEEIGGKSGYCADTMMWHKICSVFKYKFIRTPLVYYRICADQGGNALDNNFKNSVKQKYYEHMINWSKERGL